MSPLCAMLLASVALSAACAILSVLVVLRRWAFIGEGIAHAGFGGVGTAWLLALIIPALANPASIYLIAVAFCLAAGLGIAAMTRRSGLQADTAIGIFLAASLAWGFLGRSIFRAVQHQDAPDFEAYLMGDLRELSWQYALAAAAVSACVIACIFALFKEVIEYCFDPDLAQVSGLRVTFIHFLLIVLITITIIFAMRIMGQLFVTALLVLPGAAALQITRRLSHVFLMSLAFATIAAIAGPLIHARSPNIPAGPAISLLMLAEFVLAYTFSPMRKTRRA